jgi:DNA (cytosine-5)-methyltransferase 1
VKSGCNYYNEVDPYASAWLKELIKDKLIPNGEVDERSIEDVTPNDLRGFTQHHFFAGLGGWSYALQLAGWPADKPVWTGSCPCQPFSTTGKAKGTTDERHLWPAWFHLISQCKPAIVFGEQVETAVQHGWLDLVSSDLEAQNYAFAAAVLGAHSVGAPHRRQRLFWVANSQFGRNNHQLPAVGRPEPATEIKEPEASSEATSVNGIAGCLGNSVCNTGDVNPQRQSVWENSTLYQCSDSKFRPIKPGILPLVDGLPNRVALIRGAGNAIVPQVAAEFIKAAESPITLSSGGGTSVSVSTVKSGPCPRFRYPGGKANLAPHLVKQMPKVGRTFVDVFGGRGNILFRAIHEGLEFDQWVINDTAMAPFYRAIKEYGMEFRCTEKTGDEFYRLKELAKQGDFHALLMEPWVTFSGSVYSRSGPTTSGGVRTAARYETNVRLACAYMREKKVKIVQKDWLDCIESEGLGAADFVIFDPPYVNSDCAAYSCDSVSHLELVNYLKNAKHRWLLNEHEEPLYVMAFGEPILRKRVPTRITAFRKTQKWRTECLWANK